MWDLKQEIKIKILILPDNLRNALLFIKKHLIDLKKIYEIQKIEVKRIRYN